jgi:hypothetical protein
MKYIGQTGRSFQTRFQQHFHDYKYANNKSKLTHNLFDNRHSIGPKEDIMDITYNYEQRQVIGSSRQILHLQWNMLE